MTTCHTPTTHRCTILINLGELATALNQPKRRKIGRQIFQKKDGERCDHVTVNGEGHIRLTWPDVKDEFELDFELLGFLGLDDPARFDGVEVGCWNTDSRFSSFTVTYVNDRSLRLTLQHAKESLVYSLTVRYETLRLIFDPKITNSGP